MANVLIVLDGTYRFAEPADTQDFTYIELVDALTTAGHQVTKAHRTGDATADIAPFNFATSTDLLQFDVIWLIGFSGRNSSNATGASGAGIGDPELAAIARFMATGGGVFATGDHDSIGSEMCGHIPRVRSMRCWYGPNDSASPMPADFPRNFPPITAARADTTRQNPAGSYSLPGVVDPFVWFQNQSDAVPQPIAAKTIPAHPILMRGGSVVTVYPDHMHEGNTLGGEIDGYDYEQSLSFNGESFPEFPKVAGHHEMPAVIATGQTVAFANRTAVTTGLIGNNGDASAMKAINTLSVYDGRVAGVGRVVTGSTFHHYVDINLTGDSAINSDALKARTGPDAEKGHGFAHAGAEGTRADIRAVFANITQWLARPRPSIQLILERSTFSQDEAAATPDFNGAILVIVDGLKPNQFPGGPIDDLTPSAAKLLAWAPTITPQEPTGITVTPTGVASDDPSLPDRLQRFTFTYRISISANAGGAFGFSGNNNDIQLDAQLISPAASGSLTDSAWIQLVKSANPFMLDLADGNQTIWLSSDVKTFPVVAGTSMLGVDLPDDATRAQALQFLHDLVDDITVAQFVNLSGDQGGSALSPFPTTTSSNKKVYNFAIARVRLAGVGASADAVRLFFRIVPSPTTAALTYQETGGVPAGSYKKTPGATPIALPGTNAANTEWLSFPVFAAARLNPPSAQTDPDNVKTLAPGTDTFFGALIDNNLNDLYLPQTPGGGAALSLPTLMMGEHQCLVAQIEFPGTPIPNGANPFTSDKLAQRNIAFSSIANPGLDASRMALHTFELEATPQPVSEILPPDEILLEWRGSAPPDGAEVRLYLPGWNAQDVVALADRFYPRHEIRALDAHTVALPGGGARYVPIPTGGQRRTGVIAIHFPLGVKAGQRYDLAVRQITNRGRFVEPPPPKVRNISKQEAAGLLRGTKEGVETGAEATVERGVFELGQNRVLITDLRVLDAAGDHAVLVEHPSAEEVASARRQSARWRQTIGAFQLGIPVSVKAEMLPHSLRLLSVLRWRAEHLRPSNRWYQTFIRYVDLHAERVRALGGDPYQVPPTPDGDIPLPGQNGAAGGDDTIEGLLKKWFRHPMTCGLLVIIVLLVIILLFLLWRS